MIDGAHIAKTLWFGYGNARGMVAAVTDPKGDVTTYLMDVFWRRSRAPGAGWPGC
jgi:hypothetical protein